MNRRKLIQAGLAIGVTMSPVAQLLAADAVAGGAKWTDPFPVKGKVTVAEFGAKWCAGCPEMEAIFNKVKAYYGDRVAMVYVDIDQYPGIEDKYLVAQLPGQRFFDIHGEPIWHHNGALTEEELKERIEILLKRAEEDKAAGKV